MSKFEQVEEKKDKKSKTIEPPKQTVQRDLADVNGPEGGMLPSDVTAKIQSKRGGGQRLSEQSVQRYSQKFGRDMSDVHVHTDAESDTISRSLNAKAFTIGSDVFLTKGINPDGGGSSMETMTHELTHVVQQGGNAGFGALKLGAADTAQEHEAESTAQREFDPKVKEEDDGEVQREYKVKNQASNTVQRGFWGDLGSAIAGSFFNAIGIGDAMGDFMAGDQKVKAAVAKMDDQQKIRFNARENIKRDSEEYIPSIEKEIKSYQKRLQKIEGDPNMADEREQIESKMESAQQALDGRKADVEGYMREQLNMLQSIDATITSEDLNRFRSGKAKTFFSSVFASIGSNILGSFEKDPDKKAEVKAKSRNSINNWWSSANKPTLNNDKSESEKAAEAEQIKQRQNDLVDDIWNDVEKDPQLSQRYTKLLFKREIASNHMTMIQDSIKENESDEDIKASVLMMMRNNIRSGAEIGGQQPQVAQAQA